MNITTNAKHYTTKLLKCKVQKNHSNWNIFLWFIYFGSDL